jgi:hypothetical protein
MTVLDEKVNKSRYDLGLVTMNHRGVKSTTSVGHPTIDILVKYTNDIYDYEVGYVPNGFQNRPDLISDLFYGSPGNWWLLMLVNNINDPFEGFNVGDKILIPKL